MNPFEVLSFLLVVAFVCWVAAVVIKRDKLD